ncbi:hypothetical protein HYN76_22950 [Vibrio parahaemolyticus]|uniref:hypothetical protein n=1 Tax=Vibrio parahaemolyticus TaxID=670 RepID=UPI000A3A8B78|nr:hypothetical protein [Vibrio parahaemolyticus]MBM5091844.1 hypothetical protein [Vibrio parahaemolyticus]MBM5184679.1 hypothetical protein [Vibrio parahaemolyticus]OUD44785.1 hypothetical protein BS624_14720 [Vibrio parahaemolyticus]
MVEYKKVDADTFTELYKLRDEHNQCEQAYLDGVKQFHAGEIDREALRDLFAAERQSYKAADEFFQKNFGIQTL